MAGRGIAFAGILALFSSLALAAPVTYEIDPAHSSAQFSVKHMMISNVRGEFAKMSGTLVYDPDNLGASSVTATIDANSINTRNQSRDNHLKSADFFDTSKFPTLEFKSTEVKRQNGKLQLRGDLTMHGVTRQVTLEVEGPNELKEDSGSARLGASATTKINRKDWGLIWNRALEAGGLTVGDEVTITLDIEAVRRSGAPVVKTADVRR